MNIPAHILSRAQAQVPTPEIATDEHGRQWQPVASFFVPGLPAPGGNKSAIPVMGRNGPVLNSRGRPIINIVESNNKASRLKTTNWRAIVALSARTAYAGQPLNGPLALSVHFVMPRLKAHYRTGKHSDELKIDAPFYHESKPDLTKLMRPTEDALTGIVWMDDSKVSQYLGVSKVYGDVTGAGVTVYALFVEPSDAGPSPAQYPEME